jgi:hypothetical protein
MVWENPSQISKLFRQVQKLDNPFDCVWHKIVKSSKKFTFQPATGIDFNKTKIQMEKRRKSRKALVDL